MRKCFSVMLIVGLVLVSIFPMRVLAKANESDEVLYSIKEESVEYFGETYIKRVYESSVIKTAHLSERNELFGEEEKIIRVEYLRNSGSYSVYGTDITYGVSYTLTLSFDYVYHNGIKYCKPTSTSASVDLGPDGTQLDYQYFVLYNTGFTYGNQVGDYVYYTPSYYGYSTYRYCSAPVYFEYATKWDGGTFPGNLVDYTLYLKRGNSHWSASDSISCD